MATASVSELYEKVMGSISACRKRLAMYPPGHPRLVETVETLRESILEYTQKTGAGFVIEAFAPATIDSSGAGEQKHVESPDETSVSAFLRRRHVKSLLIKKGVTSDELTRFCMFLAQDDSKPGRSVNKTTPFSSPHIRATPVAPTELAFDLSTPVARKSTVTAAAKLLSATAPKFWESLSPQSQAFMQTALESPEIKRRIEQAKAKLDARTRGGRKSTDGCVDLLGTILKAAIEEPALNGIREMGPEEIANLIHGATNFIEQNVEALSARISSRPDETDAGFVRETLLDAMGSNQGVTSLAGVVHGDKQRLEFLFRTAKGKAALPPAEKAPPAIPATADVAPAGGGHRDDKIVLGQLEEVLAGAPLDFELLRTRLEETSVTDLHHVIVLELIARGSSTLGNPQCWPLLMEAIGQSASTPQQMEKVIAQGCSRIRASQSEPLTAFVLELILKLGHPAAISRLLEDVIYPQGGFSLCAAFLKLLEARLPKLTASICCTVIKRGNQELRQLAEDKLLGLSSSPEILSSWALDSPASLLHQRTLKLAISKHSSQAVFDTFKRHFVSSKEAEACRFLSMLPSAVPATIDIMYAAMESPVAKIRHAAIASLWKSSSPPALKVISEILKKNNTLETPDMDEVNAALQALSLFEGLEAMDFRQEIMRSRRALRYVYRKEIRKALAVIHAQSTDRNAAEKQT